MSRRLRAVGSTESWAASLPDAFLRCRDLGHQWDPYTAKDGGREGIARVLVCARCASFRKQLLTPGGHVLSNGYKHAEGYLRKGTGVAGPEGRDAIRLESARRTMPGDGNVSKAIRQSRARRRKS